MSNFTLADTDAAYVVGLGPATASPARTDLLDAATDETVWTAPVRCPDNPAKVRLRAVTK